MTDLVLLKEAKVDEIVEGYEKDSIYGMDIVVEGVTYHISLDTETREEILGLVVASSNWPVEHVIPYEVYNQEQTHTLDLMIGKELIAVIFEQAFTSLFTLKVKKKQLIRAANAATDEASLDLISW